MAVTPAGQPSARTSASHTQRIAVEIADARRDERHVGLAGEERGIVERGAVVLRLEREIELVAPFDPAPRRHLRQHLEVVEDDERREVGGLGVGDHGVHGLDTRLLRVDPHPAEAKVVDRGEIARRECAQSNVVCSP